MDVLKFLVVLFFVNILVALLLGWMAHSQRKSVQKVVGCCLVGSLVGGLMALILLDAEEEPVTVVGETTKPKRSSRKAPTGTRKKELERLLGDGR